MLYSAKQCLAVFDMLYPVGTGPRLFLARGQCEGGGEYAQRGRIDGYLVSTVSIVRKRWTKKLLDPTDKSDKAMKSYELLHLAIHLTLQASMERLAHSRWGPFFSPALALVGRPTANRR